MSLNTNAIRAITIDLDDTLWPCWPTIKRAEEATLEWLQVKVPKAVAEHTIDSLRQHRKETIEQFPSLGHDLTLTRLKSLELLLAEHNYDASLAEEASNFFRHLRNQVDPFAEVLDVLQALKARYPLVSLTNGNAQVEKTPLKGCFHHSLDAASVGAAKPHPLMFSQAAKLAGVLPVEILHIGDDPHRDIAPAMDLGMQAIWINRYGDKWPKELPTATQEMTSLTPLLTLLNN